MDYNVFLPEVSKSGPPEFWGLAYAMPEFINDWKLVNASCYYTWGPDPSLGIDIPFTPMLWSGDPDHYPDLSIDKNYGGDLLWMNEPNVAAQLNCSPEIAIQRLIKTKQRFPYARLIGPNHSAFAKAWIVEFHRRMMALPQQYHLTTWGIHGYMEWNLGAEHIIQMIEECHALTGGDYWITEFGELHGFLSNFRNFTSWIYANRSWIQRAYAYTNRQPDPKDNSWVISYNVNLVNDQGGLTAMGECFANLPR